MPQQLASWIYLIIVFSEKQSWENGPCRVHE